MITLEDDEVVFRFPEVHKDANLRVNFQRTLRIPDDGKDYPLPAGLGRFPVRHIEDYGERIPQQWSRRGGVILPIHNSEALWLSFDSRNYSPVSRWASETWNDIYYSFEKRALYADEYPFALKVAAGKINAVNGKSWSTELLESDPVARSGYSGNPSRGYEEPPQDYVVVPTQPWLDGFCVEKGNVRQFVAISLGQGATVEEQITGQGEHGGLQLIAYPMKADKWEEILKARRDRPIINDCLDAVSISQGAMGLGAGGRMRQSIEEDPYGIDAWDMEHSSRCFVMMANASIWEKIAGEAPTTKPLTSADYQINGLPWFEYYAENSLSLPGSPQLAKVESVVNALEKRGITVDGGNESITPTPVRVIKSPRIVSEGDLPHQHVMGSCTSKLNPSHRTDKK